MTRPDLPPRRLAQLLGLLMALIVSSAPALQNDRQQPLEINADSTNGSLGDGRAQLRGNVLIRQGSLLIKADVAEVEKVEGRVREVILTGNPVHLEQEIEQQGVVQATANRIEYRVATGLVTLMGSADVQHPQYRVSGDVLKYDLNEQHFQGSGEQDNGRIRIELDPELIENRENSEAPAALDADRGEEQPDPEAGNEDEDG